MLPNSRQIILVKFYKIKYSKSFTMVIAKLIWLFIVLITMRTHYTDKKFRFDLKFKLYCLPLVTKGLLLMGHPQ